jgi:8-oxo-dGTP pyrophosphatase MutT (NUDIX family)
MAHIHDKIDWTAGVYIVHANKVLLRLHDKYKIWIHVGGHVELDEDPVAAAKRECKEEVGLDITIYGEAGCPQYADANSRELPVPAHMNIHHVGDSGHQHIDCIYYATSESSNVIPENADDQWEWLTRDEIASHPNITSKIRAYALGALDALGEK